jgi:flagellin
MVCEAEYEPLGKGRKKGKGTKMISLQTNVDSLNAQRNLGIDNSFQSKTIQQLTSGYRINSSGDDAAGLAIANGYRSSIAELNQGVSNANDGTSQLQIIDGGLSNISTILDRLKTLATQSASSTFTGSRATLNQEYSGLLSEIDRQAGNINLNSGGTFNNVINVYIGGASTTANASITVDLSGTSSAVDSASLGLGTSNVLGGGVGISGNATRVDAPGAAFVKGTAGTNDQAFTFNLFSGGNASTITATVAASAAGSSLTTVLSSLNGQLNKYGITAGTDSNGLLQFSGSTAFSVNAAAAAGGSTTGITSAGTGDNTSNYTVGSGAGNAYTVPTAAETLSFQTSQGSVSATLAIGDNLDSAISKINAKTSSAGVYAIKDSAGTGIEFQSANSFSVGSSLGATSQVLPAAASSSFVNATGPASGSTNNASSAITNLGLVQGRIGAGENKLQYASNLAQSQISSFSAAQSQIRDANVAQQAANLTKAQVLTQTSVAALAQANSEPQSVLKLLQ